MSARLSRTIQVINFGLISLLIMLTYQNCAGRVETGAPVQQAQAGGVDAWSMTLLAESGEIIHENDAVHLTVNAPRSLEGAVCQWTHERRGQSTRFETPDCSLALEAITFDDEGLYSARVLLPDGDSVVIGPVLVQVFAASQAFPNVGALLSEYGLNVGTQAAIMASPNLELSGDSDCAIEWRNIESGARVGCGRILSLGPVQESSFGDHQVSFTRGDQMHVHYFTVLNKSARDPASKPISCGHSIGRVADLISDLRSAVPEAYVGEFGDFRWTLAGFNRESADRLCTLADPSFFAASSAKVQRTDLSSSGLPVVNVRSFDPMTRRWASLCSTTDLNAGSCQSYWVLQSLSCCKAN